MWVAEWAEGDLSQRLVLLASSEREAWRQVDDYLLRCVERFTTMSMRPATAAEIKRGW